MIGRRYEFTYENKYLSGFGFGRVDIRTSRKLASDSVHVLEHEESLNFNHKMTCLIRELVLKVPEFSHIDVSRILVSATLNKKKKRGGLLAYVIPLRYREGNPVKLCVRGGKVFHWVMLPRYYLGQEVLYYTFFLLPRFLNLSFREKLETVVHELFHIHPAFNGDIRMFRGRFSIHGSLRTYQIKVKQITESFLAEKHDSDCYTFLKEPYRNLVKTYGKITAFHFCEPRPKLLKVTYDLI